MEERFISTSAPAVQQGVHKNEWPMEDQKVAGLSLLLKVVQLLLSHCDFPLGLFAPVNVVLVVYKTVNSASEMASI